MTLEAGLLILIACLIAVIVRVTMRIIRRDDPVKVHFAKCSGDCGKKVMLIGRRQQYGECVFCARCQININGTR